MRRSDRRFARQRVCAYLLATIGIVLYVWFLGFVGSVAEPPGIPTGPPSTRKETTESFTILPPIETAAQSGSANIITDMTMQKGMEESTKRPSEASNHRPPLMPGNWSHGDLSEIFSELKAQYPGASEELLRERAEFGSLNICSPYHIWYSCMDNPTCIEHEACTHRLTEPPVSLHQGYKAPFRFAQDAELRKQVLTEIINRMERTTAAGTLKKDGYIMIMTLNSGFSFLFGNWLCSLSHYNIDVDEVRRKTLVLPRDDDARNYVESLGFFTPTTEELAILTNWTSVHLITRRAAPAFGQGDHKHLNLFFKFGMPLDLLDLGLTVFLQDVDFIWFRNPLPLMQKQCAHERCHGLFIAEGRPVVRHTTNAVNPWRKSKTPIMELNTGLFMLVPQPEVKHFLRVLMHGVHLQQWRRRDQLYYNSVAWHDHFREMRWRSLPEDIFVPGKRLHRAELAEWPLKPVEELVVIHLSDTGNYEEKIKRLKTINHWYFTKDQCPVPVRQCGTIYSCWHSLRSCAECQELDA